MLTFKKPWDLLFRRRKVVLGVADGFASYCILFAMFLTRLFIFAKSEERFKNQVLYLSRQKDELSKEVSNLKEEIMYLNEDFVNMERDAAKVAKLTRKKAQAAKVHLFNDFCDSRGIHRVPLDLEVFSDDEPTMRRKLLLMRMKMMRRLSLTKKLRLRNLRVKLP